MSLVLPPGLIYHKAKQIVDLMGISDEKFKASWGWFTRFQHRFDLNVTNLFGEGGEFDKTSAETLQALEELCSAISHVTLHVFTIWMKSECSSKWFYVTQCQTRTCL